MPATQRVPFCEHRLHVKCETTCATTSPCSGNTATGTHVRCSRPARAFTARHGRTVPKCTGAR